MHIPKTLIFYGHFGIESVPDPFFLSVTIVILPDMWVPNLITKLFMLVAIESQSNVCSMTVRVSRSAESRFSLEQVNRSKKKN